ncbi:TlyA family RNA methyltransferase [Dictyobacter aurantiacus]|uniref:TlyA family rRNA (Cytidine-2'-O)-methyltransferase n=1 Tax=Dictyobacter aurantiacus TaxID=1936993 RepID=A0A401ZHC6_9CHLR|nr:TlyA family RNA methyltransferase [Dictyobacter aurantiacus]GCE06098.1 TlyA family rRNA (cytidine-2'-O)-methyltransferase [Dictyobacter aurantiacus]
MSSISDHHLNDHKSEQGKNIAPKRRLPLASLLVERGIFAHVDEARRWIMAGKVLVNDQLMDKPGMAVPRDARLRVRGRARYASRAGYKLEAALAAFAVEVAGQVALDCGASTGGFTDCLLQRGVEIVYSVDVGYGQLLGRLRVDPRVRNLERTNLSDLTAYPLQPAPTLITLDLSYLSLTKALPVAARLLAPEGQILTLVKPLFEVESQDARRSGRIDDVALLVEALHQVVEAGLNCGLSLQGIVKLALRPRYGVHEFFASFVRRPDVLDWQYDEHTLLTIVQGLGIGEIYEE